jgi:hypothetical protein
MQHPSSSSSDESAASSPRAFTLDVDELPRRQYKTKAYDSARAKAKYQLFKKVRASYDDQLAEKDAIIRAHEQEILLLQTKLIHMSQQLIHTLHPHNTH